MVRHGHLYILPSQIRKPAARPFTIFTGGRSTSMRPSLRPHRASSHHDPVPRAYHCTAVV
ncbi:hypothetical protein C8Q74DRAFT_1297781 [Fomes fomentarius]|nr:hypothetical protein C8Q74DRAFT_1297781 [Fomes fomentarius]